MRTLADCCLIALLLTMPFVTDWSVIIKPAMKQVPRLEALHEGEKIPMVCAAVVVNKDDGYAVTAAHCIEKPDAEGIAITVSGKHAEAVKVNRLLDVAVVKYDAKKDEQMELADATPAVGSEVAIVGYPFGDGKLAPTFGHISQVLNDESKQIWVNADLIFGDSGGALIDQQGKLVGLNSKILYNGPAHLGGCVPVEALREFLKPYLPTVKK